jgi:microcystin-dependent protein
MVWRWSKTASNNATADSTINWAEGQAPSSINDSARAEMARVAQWRDDISGSILTTGTSTAFAVSSNQVFDTLAHMDGAMVSFRMHTTNGSGGVTLNVDGLGAKPLVITFGRDLPAASLIAYTIYKATYNASDQVWYLHGFYDLPWLVPVGGLLPYISTSGAPNSSFVQPYGQALSRTTYATLYSLVGTAYGAGDGSTTFNIPDLRGRVPIANDAIGGVAAGRVTTAGAGFDGTAYGATGGSQNKTLGITEIPAHNHGVTDTHQHGFTYATQGGIAGGGAVTVVTQIQQSGQATGVQTTATNTGSITTQNAGGGTAFPLMQPSIVLNYILRVI